MGTMKNWLRLLRVKQWTKNAIVFAAFIFAWGDRSQNLTMMDFWKVALAALLFSFISSAVYILNDWKDIPQDLLHPIKKKRPLAAGTISVGRALPVAVGLLAVGLIGGWLLSPPFCGILLCYLALQVVYTLWLKKIPLVDVLVIAIGFVLRALAGAYAIHVPISPWLLLCALFLALFLGLCKRRHEKVNLAGTGTREVLDHYDERLLDMLIAMIGATALVCYSIYTLWPDTVAKFGTNRLGLTIPFVIFGLFRYMDLVYRQDKGDRPEHILLSDIPLIIDIALYGAVVLLIFIFR